jgi:predicted RNA binding protein YcfA (HicA-like mRNA interferase family)
MMGFWESDSHRSELRAFPWVISDGRRRMEAVKIRELIRLIEGDGWRQVRTTGSHRHFKHPSKPNVVTMPGSSGDDVPVGTPKAILKAAGVEKRR